MLPVVEKLKRSGKAGWIADNALDKKSSNNGTMVAEGKVRKRSGFIKRAVGGEGEGEIQALNVQCEEKGKVLSFDLNCILIDIICHFTSFSKFDRIAVSQETRGCFVNFPPFWIFCAAVADLLEMKKSAGQLSIVWCTILIRWQLWCTISAHFSTLNIDLNIIIITIIIVIIISSSSSSSSHPVAALMHNKCKTDLNCTLTKLRPAAVSSNDQWNISGGSRIFFSISSFLIIILTLLLS